MPVQKKWLHEKYLRRFNEAADAAWRELAKKNTRNESCVWFIWVGSSEDEKLRPKLQLEPLRHLDKAAQNALLQISNHQSQRN